MGKQRNNDATTDTDDNKLKVLFVREVDSFKTTIPKTDALWL